MTGANEERSRNEGILDNEGKYRERESRTKRGRNPDEKGFPEQFIKAPSVSMIAKKKSSLSKFCEIDA